MEALEFIAVGGAFFGQGMAADSGEDPLRLLGAQRCDLVDPSDAEFGQGGD